MGNCCVNDSKVSDSAKDDKSQGTHKLKNGEEVDLDFYNKPENLNKIQKIQATMREKENKKQGKSDSKKSNK